VHELHPLGPAGGHCSRMQGFMQKLMMGRGGVGCPRVPTLIALLVPMAHRCAIISPCRNHPAGHCATHKARKARVQFHKCSFALMARKEMALFIIHNMMIGGATCATIFK